MTWICDDVSASSKRNSTAGFLLICFLRCSYSHQHTMMAMAMMKLRRAHRLRAFPSPSAPSSPSSPSPLSYSRIPARQTNQLLYGFQTVRPAQLGGIRSFCKSAPSLSSSSSSSFSSSPSSYSSSSSPSGFTPPGNSSNGMIRKILVANRGEIACRIMRTARKLGLRTVAVYSDADKESLHVRMADESVCIGPPPATSSYLNTSEILHACKITLADAIHPGYGFLSENAKFAELCKQEKITFIGPPSSAIRAMGDKSESKTLMSAAGVPVVPGYHGVEQNEAFLKSEADKIGYPVIIKATQGGGGKGMRIVSSSAEFLENLHSAKREALSSFGDDRVLVEKYILKPRHIEVQVFGDQHGNVVHLFERDCSVQRRHQKIIEEAPAPRISKTFRQHIGQAAVDAAKAVGYYNAGTVEFIVDSISEEFFFMEMNTRLQVEHPITEMITQQDLVEWQIRVASGESLPCRQNDLSISGHSFEARIYAENVQSGFLPATGILHHYRSPESSPTIRIETGVQQGDNVSIYYDPMIAKLVVWGHDRLSALLKLHDSLSKFQISGVPTNIGFLKILSRHHAFSAGEVETHFIDNYRSELFDSETLEERSRASDLSAAVAACYICIKDTARSTQTCSKGSTSGKAWSSLPGFRLNYENKRSVVLKGDEDVVMEMLVTYCRNGSCEVKGLRNGNPMIMVTIEPQLMDSEFKVLVDGVTKRVSASFYKKESAYHVDVWCDDKHHEFSFVNPLIDIEGFELEASGLHSMHKKETNLPSGGITAPMAGRLVRVLVDEGARVKKGDSLVILEAMKMEHVVRAPKDGYIKHLILEAGQYVKDNAMLLIIDEQISVSET